MLEIGLIIKKQRNDRKLSLRQLASLVYNNEKYASRISNIENGKTKNVTFETIQKILTHLGIDLLSLAKNQQNNG